MNRALLNLRLIAVLFLVSFSQAVAQNVSTKQPSENAAQSVVANQNLPQQIIPLKLSIYVIVRGEERSQRLIGNNFSAEDFGLFSGQSPSNIYSLQTTLNSNSENHRVKLENTKVAREYLYKNLFLPNYKSQDGEHHQAAYRAAQNYLNNFASDNDEIVKYLQRWIQSNGPCTYGAIFVDVERFNKAVSEDNLAETFAAGRNILSRQPDCLTAILFMINAGHIQTSIKKIEGLDEETIFYAQQAIKKIEGGETPENGWRPFDDKNDALAWLNYSIAFIYHFRKHDIKSAAPYLYQATKHQSREISPSFVPYTILGEWYLDQYNQAASEYNVVRGNPKIAQAVKDKLAKKWQLLADRALEVYSHSYELLKKSNKSLEWIGKIKPALIELYRLRRSIDDSKLDAFTESIREKSITDPAITINP